MAEFPKKLEKQRGTSERTRLPTESECRVCRFAFTDMAAFEYHTVDHMLGKSHNCSHCGKLFMWPSHLTKHLRTHREPSFPCSVCGEKFHTIDGRRNHIYAYHVGSQD